MIDLHDQDSAPSTPWKPPLPTQVPAVHAALLRWVGSAFGIITTAEAHAHGDSTIVPIAPTPMQSAMAVHAEELRRLRDAHLYAVDDEMTAQAIAAGTRLSDWSLTPSDLPCEQGFVIYDAPIGYTDTGHGAIPVVACSWGPSPGCAPPQGAVWLTFWTAPDPDSLALAGMNAFLGEDTDELLGDSPVRLLWDDEALVSWSSDAPEIPTEPYLVHRVDDITGIIASDRTVPWIRTIIATWLLIQQPTVTEIAEQHASRPQRRRAQRTGRVLPPVRVVSIHRAVHRSPRPLTPSGRVVGVRFPVEGFWRNQPYGQERALRRRQWIAEHWRGPRDAPVLDRPKVHRVESALPEEI